MTIKQHPSYKFDIDLTGFSLPQGFLFGVANSPFHVEGYYNEEGSPFNQWGRWELDGVVEKSGLANDFWRNWQPHIEKAKEIGLNAFRMGFDWTRVQPTYQSGIGPEPSFDPAAFDRYAEIVASIYEAKMEPVITIYHFIQPAWVGPNLWIEPHLVEKFMSYALTTVREVNIRLVEKGYPAIWFWVTFNEPGIPPQCTFLSCEHPHDPTRVGIESAVINQDNILSCHIRLYNSIHDLYEQNNWRTPHVGFNTVANSLYEYDKGLYDLCRARECNVLPHQLVDYFNESRRDFYQYYDRIADRRLGIDTPERQFFEGRKQDSYHSYNPLKMRRALESLYTAKRPQNMDYVGINIYEPFLASLDYQPKPGAKITVAEPFGRPPWWEWVNERQTYEDHIEIYGRDTHSLPIYILEASIGHKQEKFGLPEPRHDGLTRIQYLKETLGEVIRGIQKGFPIQGYIYWTLCDNYEWGTYTVRLGLLEYDYRTNAIKDTDGLGEPTGETFKNLIAALHSNNPQEIYKQFGSLCPEV
jgi:beta-glucosidase